MPKLDTIGNLFARFNQEGVAGIAIIDGCGIGVDAADCAAQRVEDHVGHRMRHGRLTVHHHIDCLFGQIVEVGHLPVITKAGRVEVFHDAAGPAANYHQDSAGLRYDRFRRMMVFGPAINAAGSPRTFWSWDGERWTSVFDGFPGPFFLVRHGALAYDSLTVPRTILSAPRKARIAPQPSGGASPARRRPELPRFGRAPGR